MGYSASGWSRCGSGFYGGYWGFGSSQKRPEPGLTRSFRRARRSRSGERTRSQGYRPIARHFRSTWTASIRIDPFFRSINGWNRARSRRSRRLCRTCDRRARAIAHLYGPSVISGSTSPPLPERSRCRARSPVGSCLAIIGPPHSQRDLSRRRAGRRSDRRCFPRPSSVSSRVRSSDGARQSTHCFTRSMARRRAHYRTWRFISRSSTRTRSRRPNRRSVRTFPRTSDLSSASSRKPSRTFFWHGRTRSFPRPSPFRRRRPSHRSSDQTTHSRRRPLSHPRPGAAPRSKQWRAARRSFGDRRKQLRQKSREKGNGYRADRSQSDENVLARLMYRDRARPSNTRSSYSFYISGRRSFFAASTCHPSLSINIRGYWCSVVSESRSGSSFPVWDTAARQSQSRRASIPCRDRSSSRSRRKSASIIGNRIPVRRPSVRPAGSRRNVSVRKRNRLSQCDASLSRPRRRASARSRRSRRRTQHNARQSIF